MKGKMKRNLTAFLMAFVTMFCSLFYTDMTVIAAASTDSARVQPSDFSDSYKTGEWYRKLHQVKPTGDYLKDLMAIAQSQLNYHEGDSLDEMDGAHEGDGDFAEYCYWWDEPGTLWCGEYIAWCFAMASTPYEIVKPKYQTRDKDGNTRRFSWDETGYAGGEKNYYLKQGDVILFRYSGGNHVILVDSVSVDNGIVIVEALNGNHSDNVSRGTYTIDASTGKTVNAWTSNGGYVDIIYSPDYSIASTLNFYTVTFDPNGGKADWTEKKLSNNASYGVMPLPVKDGYVFDGWYTKVLGGEKITSYLRVSLTGDQTLYAHWKSGSDDPKEEIDTSRWGFDPSTGTITSIPYDWTGGKIPSTIKGVPVTAIGDFAASGRKHIEKLVIPSSVKAVGRYAFYNCTELETVTFEGDPSKISYGRGVFQNTLFLRPDFSDPYKRSEYYQKLMNVELTGDYVEDCIAIAGSQEGYHEGNSFEEMDGSNKKGNGDYAEMAYFTSSPSYRWWPYEEEYQYGGWCGNFCNWCMRMASIPEELHSWWTVSRDSDYPTWEDTVYAGGKKGLEIKRGDVLKMNIGHLCLVTDVRTEGDEVIIGTWNGNNNNDVGFDYNRFRASDGYNLTMAEEYNRPGGTDYGEKYQVKWIEPVLPGEIDSVQLYTVTFDGNGGAVHGNKATKKLAASSYYGIMPIPQREGYHFDGWYTEKEGGKKITAYHRSGLTSDTTLYAHWRGREEISGGLVHRMYNPNSGEHFYTLSDEERDDLVSYGWIYEAGCSFTAPGASSDTVPVYRLYDPNGNGHHFTLDKEETTYLANCGWTFEGISFYAYKNDSQYGVPVYRGYNPNNGHHNFTTDRKEHDIIVGAGWRDEGIAWKVYNGS